MQANGEAFTRSRPGGYFAHTHPRKGPDEESAEDDDGLELPVNPDQGTPLIPDEEGNATVPS